MLGLATGITLMAIRERIGHTTEQSATDTDKPEEEERKRREQHFENMMNYDVNKAYKRR